MTWALWLLAAPAQEVRLPEKERFHLYLLVGQSNMAGRGKVVDEDRRPHPRVLALDKSGKWVPPVDPIHFDKRIAGVGLGRTFGIRIAEKNPKITVGLIPCAAGGSRIDSWKPGGYHGQTKSHPYDDSIKRARIALKVGTLKGILWHQGEGDAHKGLAEAYEGKLHALIARFRKALGAADVPFIAGQMGRFDGVPWDDFKKRVDAAHRALPSKVSRCAFVSAEGLGQKGDKVHFNAEAYRELGKRYTAAYFDLIR